MQLPAWVPGLLVVAAGGCAAAPAASPERAGEHDAGPRVARAWTKGDSIAPYLSGGGQRRVLHIDVEGLGSASRQAPPPAGRHGLVTQGRTHRGIVLVESGAYADVETARDMLEGVLPGALEGVHFIRLPD